MSKIWGGRFNQGTAKEVQEFTESISFDYQLAEYDLQLCRAWSAALWKAGVITQKEKEQLILGLNSVEKELSSGDFKFKPELEDIHMHIESALQEKIGPLAKKLHTGKSRNDQVATDVRLYLKVQIQNLMETLVKMQKGLVAVAERNFSSIMPGYTHLQIAQPVLLAHHLLAYVEMLERDRERLWGCYQRADVLPLGSAALAGTTYAIDRKWLAKELGFAKISENSLDAVADRDFIAEFQAAAALLMTHLSRMSEELIIWSSQEFGFVELSDQYATGSSIMPQKKNPDVPELVRGKTGTVLGHLTAILTTIKGLPLSYNRDLQEDKENLFKSVKICLQSLRLLTGVWQTIKINSTTMRAAAERGFATATDLADYLVGKGIAFRDAHEITGKIVRYCLEQQLTLKELPLAKYQKFSAKIEKDIFQFISVESSVASRTIPGGTAPAEVKKALQRVKKRIA